VTERSPRARPRAATAPAGRREDTRAPRWFVYVLECGDSSLYVGVARDVAARLAAHEAGRGAKYTRGRGPLRVKVTRRCASQGDALRIELALKRLSRADKLALLASRARFAAFTRDAITKRAIAKRTQAKRA
jgi:putative endonuclease